MKPQKILGVCSSGGHSIQLRLIIEPLKDDYACYIYTSSNNVFNKTSLTVDESMKDFNRSEPWLSFLSFFSTLKKILSIKPNLIISTGALPGVIAIAAGRLYGAKTLWIDSIANTQKLSLSGKLAKYIAHDCLSQWEEVASKEHVSYKGGLL